MLVRSLNARVLTQSRAAPSLASASVRRLTMAARPSPIALGKRPMVAPRTAGLVFGAGAARNLSFSPFKSSNPEAVSSPAAAPVAPAPAAAEPEAAAAASTSTPASAPVDTSIPSSDIASTASTPAEPALSTAQQVTATAADSATLIPQAETHALTGTLEEMVKNSGLPLEQVLNSPEAVQAACKVSDLKLIGLEHGVFNIAGWIREGLVGLHNITGLPWWASIMALTFSLRLCLGPLVVRNLKHNVRLNAVQPQMQGLMKRMGEAKAAGDQTAMAVTASNLQQLMKEHDVSPFRPLTMPLLQMPFFLGMFYALRGLANTPLPQLKEGGFSWVTDLTIPDPYYILPFTSIAFQLLVLRVGADGTGSHAAQSARTQAHTRNVLMALSPFMMLMVSQFPAAVLFYWTSTNLFTLGQAWLLKQAPVKKLLGVPTPPKLPTPPSDAEIDTNPSIKDTWQAIKDWNSENLRKARERQAEAAATVAAAKEKSASKREGTALLAERVQEAPAAPVAGETKTAAFLEDAPAQTGAAQAAAPRVSREEAKRRRISAAREKRARQ